MVAITKGNGETCKVDEACPRVQLETAVRECRLHFLRAAAAHPQIRLGDSLKEKVYEPSRRHWVDLGLPVPQRPSVEWKPEQFLALEPFQERQSRLIQEWAASQNLEYEWVYSAARDALGTEDFPQHPFGMIPGYQAPQFTLSSWHFEYESEPQYRERVKASFRKALDAHIKSVRLERSRFLRDRGSQAVHYRWAAEHVCLRWNWTRIERQNGVEVTWQAVKKAVDPILVRIGIAEYNLQKAQKRRS